MTKAVQIEMITSATPRKSTKRSIFSLVKVALTIVLVMTMEATFASAGHAAPTSFSQSQIDSYVKIVTAEIELTNNRGANFGSSATNKLYCNPTVFGQGMRSGNQGLYVWVTCNAMRKLEINTLTGATNACSGFSIPVWIEANARSVSYRAISSGSEYIAFRSSAPSHIQVALDATYNQIYTSGKSAPTPKAIKGKTAASFAGLTSCK